MKQRIEYVDVAKGVLIILVVAAHVFQNTFFFDYTYSFHMLAFFFISGMMLNHSSAMQKPYGTVVITKIRTMLIPLCFYELLGILRDLIRFGFSQSIKSFVYNTVSLRFNNGVLWFLFALFFAELICIPLIRSLKEKRWIGLAAAVFLLASFFLPETYYILIVLRNIMRAVFFLLMGYLLESRMDRRNIPAAVIGFTVLTLTTAFGLNTTIMSSELWKLPLFLLEAFCGTILVLQIGRIPQLRFLRIVGENSLTIYGTHSLYYVVFGDWLGVDFTAASLWEGFLVLLLVTIAEIPTIYLINRFLPILAGKRKPVHS